MKKKRAKKVGDVNSKDTWTKTTVHIRSEVMEQYLKVFGDVEQKLAKNKDGLSLLDLNIHVWLTEHLKKFT